jgi:multiple sugar transport system ATP-binding protein
VVVLMQRWFVKGLTEGDKSRATGVLEDVRKSFGATHVLHGIDLALASGEMLVIVGASGCGKSTLLRLVAGLDMPTRGRILLDGQDVARRDPAERDIAMVFQNYALYPHMSVFDNMAYGLKIRGLPKDRIRARVDEAAGLLGLGPLLARKPRQLSGGQRQRVAMGRALVRSPNAFLMDEPLSNLDARLRGQMRAEIASLQKRTGVTTVYVTHDQVEAMTMGHRVAVLRRGLLQQLGAPRTLYDAPANRFVAGFIGSPAMNFLGATLQRRERGFELRLGAQAIAIDASDWPGLDSAQARSIIAGLRPDAFRIATDADTAAVLPGRIAVIEDLGASLLAYVDLEGLHLVAAPEDEADDFAKAHLRLQVVLDGRLPLRAGEAIRLIPDARQLHLFDAGTGLAVPRSTKPGAG